MKNYYFVILALNLFLLFNTSKINAATYATLPFVESFENSWITGAGVRDIPSPNWVNAPVYGNNAWSRDDDGFARGAWSSNSGGYTPAGANSTAHSARFHSFDATNGTTGSLDLYIDFSSIPGAKCLSYYFINNDGVDSLEVFLSTNGGTSFSKINSKKTSFGWSFVSVPLGFRGSATAIIRFKVTSDYGTSDIGIDEIAVESSSSDLPFNEHFDNTWVNLKSTRDVPSKCWVNSPATGQNSWSRDDDGVARGAWNNYTGSYTIAGANGTAHSARFHSYGASNGTSGIFDLYLNLSSQTGIKFLSYNYINPDGNDSLEIFLSTDGGLSFTKVNSQKISASWKSVTISLGALSAVGNNGILRFKATSDYGNTDIGIDEVSVTAVNNVIPFTEHFDNAWINLKGTRDVPSLNWVNSPVTGNNSWSRDDDGYARGAWVDNQGTYPATGANGTAHSARFHSYRAANGSSGKFDVNVNFSSQAGNKTLSYYYINADGTDSLEVFLSINGGTSFTKINSQKTSTTWKLVNLSLGAQTVVNGIIRFKATSDYGNTDIGIDEVSVAGLNSQASITSFNLPGQIQSSITYATHTIDVEMPYGSSVSALAANFVLSSGATAKVGTTSQVSGTTVNNFTSTVVYAVKAQDGVTTQNWTVNVSVVVSSQANITSFSLPAQTNAYINTSAHTVQVTMPYGSSISALPATFSLSDGATAKVGTINQVSGTTTNNFTSVVIYTVTAQDGITSQNWVVTVTIAANTETSIVSFSLPGQIGNAMINTSFHAITVTMPTGTSVTSLAASFSLSAGSTTKVGSTTQVSGSTINNFTSALTYVVVAQNGITTQNWTVIVSFSQSSQTSIVSYSLPGQTSATINASAHTIAVTMPNGVSLTSLTASFGLSTGATAKVGATTQVSGSTVNNFTSPVIYVITAQDGVTTQSWTVNVTTVVFNQANITAFYIPGQTDVVINTSTHTIVVEMPYGSSISSLVANFELSDGATAKVGSTNQVSGTTVNNFTSPVTYTIKAQDGVTTQSWTVSVNKGTTTQTEIVSYSLPGQTSATINSIEHSIDVIMPSGSSVSALTATFSLSDGASAKVDSKLQVSGSKTLNFTSPVIYVVTAQDGVTTQNWTVTVTIALNSQPDIVSFSLPNQVKTATINSVNHTIDITLLYGTSTTALIAKFGLSNGATATVGNAIQVSGTTANDFTTPVSYVVTAQDGETNQDWLVTVAVDTKLNTETDIVSFHLPNQVENATINADKHTIVIKMPSGSVVSSLSAAFSLSAGASAKVGSVEQISNTTVNNFTSPVTYVVTAQDSITTQNWKVTVAYVSGISTEYANNAIDVYPNPSNGIFNLKSNTDNNLSYEVFDINGSLLIRETGFTNTENGLIDLTENPCGMYLLRISTNEGSRIVKLIKN